MTLYGALVMSVPRPQCSPTSASWWTAVVIYPQAMQYFDELLALSNWSTIRAETATPDALVGIAQQLIGELLPPALQTYWRRHVPPLTPPASFFEEHEPSTPEVVHKELGELPEGAGLLRPVARAVSGRLGNAYRESEALNAIGNVHRAMGQEPTGARDAQQPGTPDFPTSRYPRDEAEHLITGCGVLEIGEYRKALEQQYTLAPN